MDMPGDAASLHRDHLSELLLDALGGTAAQVALATLGAHQNPCPGDSKAFRGRLMGLKFIMCWLLARHRLLLLLTQNSRQRQQPWQAALPMSSEIFINYFFGLLLFRPGRSQYHYHTATFHDGGLFDGREVRQLFSHFLQVDQC